MRLLLLLCGWLLSAPVMAGAPIVAAASSLQFALEEAAAQFAQQTGHTLRLNFGSSGNFRRQIAQGAPFELFLSADEGFVQALYDEGYVDNAGVIYARGRLAWVQPAGRYSVPSEQAPLVGVQEAITAWEEGQRLRIAAWLPETCCKRRAYGKPANRCGCKGRMSPRRCSLPFPTRREVA